MFEMNSRSYRVLTGSLSLPCRDRCGPDSRDAALARKSVSQRHPLPLISKDVCHPTSRSFAAVYSSRPTAPVITRDWWVDYPGVDHLDFRVYQVKGSAKVFRRSQRPSSDGRA